jgi:lipooligosaccharide transport system permease protein
MSAPAARVVEHRFLLYRRTWRGSAFNSFFSPALFLASIGLGLGAFVQPGSTPLGIPYIVFLAPGLLAASAMQTAASEATFPVMGGLTWARSFQAMTATPIRAIDVALGFLGWVAIRLAIVSSIFTLVVVLFGAAGSGAIVLAIPAAVLTGLAFAAPIMAFSATQRDTQWFNALFRFGITPLFLFSGTFFPVDQLPIPLQAVAWLTPLFHGVALTRALSLGYATDEPLVTVAHVAYLGILATVGAVLAVRAFRARLEH